MSLNKAVKFRFLAAQLTQSEISQFVNKLMHANKNIILKALFTHLSNTSTNANQQSDHEADNMNTMISNIILSRKQKPKPIPTQNIKLDEFPKRLIGQISSFLQQYDYINFSKTNRFIFLGCNSPNLLQELDLKGIENYSGINFALYPSVKDLRLDFKKFNKSIPAINGLSTMNELQSIELDANGENIDIDNFLRSNDVNVSKLRCSNFGKHGTHPFSTDKFMRLLTKFPSIQYLYLYGMFAPLDTNNLNKIKDLYPNLKGLKVNGGTLTVNRSLINRFGNNLEYLSTEFYANFDFQLNTTNFGKLEELELRRPTMKSINDILLTAENLKKIVFKGTTFMTADETKKMMTKLIISCKSLEFIDCYVDVSVAELFKSVLDGIENGLFKTTKRKRNQMKIMITVVCNDTFGPNDFLLNIGKVVHWLDYSNINDFMFALYLKDLSQKIDTDILLKELKSNCLSTNVKVTRFYTYNCFLLTNTDCKIAGLFESFKI